MSGFGVRHDLKGDSSETVVNHGIILRDRKMLDITGVKAVESFDSEEFLLDTDGGFVVIKGKNLQMKNLDVVQGKVSIVGRIDQFEYIDVNSESNNKNKGFFQKIFK